MLRSILRVRVLTPIIVLLFVCLTSSSAFAALAVNPIFRSDMVLQRGMTCPVFGTGDIGSTVTVSFQNQTVSTTVGSDGRWQVNLASMPASTVPGTMTVSATGSSSVAFTGVQVGEVWLFSGQSNMEWNMGRADEGAAYIADSVNHNIRLFKMMGAGNGPSTTSWQAANSTTTYGFSAVGYWMGLELSKSLNVPIGLIQATHSGTNISEWQTTNGGSGADYITMVKAIQPFAIRGVGWYQGESNAGDVAYEKKLTDLIAEWRGDWGLPNLPFGIVQLPGASGYGAQLGQFNVSQKVANTWLAVICDLPDTKKLHPTNKKPVALRLALGARALIYGENVEYSGPIRALPPASFVIGNKVVLNWTHIGNGLFTRNGGAPTTFEVADATGRYQPATAVIVGNIVEVSSSRVSNPKRLRYQFNIVGNLSSHVSIPVEGGAATITELPTSMFEINLP